MTSFNLYKPRATSTSALYTSSTTPPSLRQQPLPPPLLTSRRWRSSCTPAPRVYVNAFFKGLTRGKGKYQDASKWITLKQMDAVTRTETLTILTSVLNIM